jgi:hypothetical protein
MDSQRKKRRVGDHRVAIKSVRPTHAKHGSTIVEPLKTIGHFRAILERMSVVRLSLLS